MAFAAYASKKYLAERGRPVRGKGLSGHDIVAYNWQFQGHEPARDGRVVLRTNSTHMLLHAVRLGLGIGPLPCFLAGADRALERVPSSLPAEADELWLVVHADVQRTTRVRAVIEAIEERLSRLADDLSTGAGP